MRVKVIKEVKGLVEGDILYYNSENDRYELTKTDYDISDSGKSTKVVKFSISSYLVEEFKDHFVCIDDTNNEIEINRIYYDDFPESITNKAPEEVPVEVPTEPTAIDEISKLQEQIKELEKELEDVKKYSRVNSPYWTYNPFSRIW